MEEVIKMFVLLIFGLIVMALMLAGIDSYFELTEKGDYLSMLGLNLIFTFSSMLIIGFSYVLAFNSLSIKGDEEKSRFALILSFILIYLLKLYLVNNNEFVFSYPYLLSLLSILLMTLIPYGIYKVTHRYVKPVMH